MIYMRWPWGAHKAFLHSWNVFFIMGVFQGCRIFVLNGSPIDMNYILK